MTKQPGGGCSNKRDSGGNGGWKGTSFFLRKQGQGTACALAARKKHARGESALPPRADTWDKGMKKGKSNTKGPQLSGDFKGNLLRGVTKRAKRREVLRGRGGTRHW